jgi:hypothetical protein
MAVGGDLVTDRNHFDRIVEMPQRQQVAEQHSQTPVQGHLVLGDEGCKPKACSPPQTQRTQRPRREKLERISAPALCPLRLCGE